MMEKVFHKTPVLRDMPRHYCPGCGHGIVQRLIGEVLEELDVLSRTVGVLGVGCSSPSWPYMNYDMLSVAHGRPGAGATGLKRCAPDKLVFTYQGDGDIGSIGLSETMYAAIRGENITMICVNNTIYAMTGGQMAPTTLEGQVTTTSPGGRDVVTTGYPLHLPEMLAGIPNARFVARCSLHDTANIRKTKQTIKKAFTYQLEGKGYSMLEILSPCPSIWNMSAPDCMERIADEIMKEYPLGVYKDIDSGVNAKEAAVSA